MKKYILLIVVVLWAGLIYYASSRDSATSNRHSKYVITIVTTNAVRITNKLRITKIEINNNNISRITNKLNYPIRKLAHFSIYFILGILIYLTTISFGASKKSIYIIILICFIYSLTDEYHQAFIVGRSSKFLDCLIDTSGSITGCLIELLIINKLENIR